MHASVFRSASFLPLASTSAVHSSSKSNSCVYRLNSWLHSISVWVFDKGFWWNPFELFSWNLFAVCSLGHEMQQESCWVYRVLVLRSKSCICSTERNILLYSHVYILGLGYSLYVYFLFLKWLGHSNYKIKLVYGIWMVAVSSHDFCFPPIQWRWMEFWCIEKLFK